MTPCAAVCVPALMYRPGFPKRPDGPPLASLDPNEAPSCVVLGKPYLPYSAVHLLRHANSVVPREDSATRQNELHRSAEICRVTGTRAVQKPTYVLVKTLKLIADLKHDKAFGRPPGSANRGHHPEVQTTCFETSRKIDVGQADAVGGLVVVIGVFVCRSDCA